MAVNRCSGEVLYMKRWGIVLAAVVAVAALAGCGGGASKAPGVTVELKAENMTWGSKELKLTKNQPVKLVLNNQDGVLHDFVIDKIPAKVEHSAGASHGHSASAKSDLHVAAEAGKQGSVEFTPTKPGSYTYYCSEPGHKEAGMTGTLIVN